MHGTVAHVEEDGLNAITSKELNENRCILTVASLLWISRVNRARVILVTKSTFLFDLRFKIYRFLVRRV